MRIAQIRELDISNGEGIGISLFVQGCHFHCEGCFNSETWDFNGGKEWAKKTNEEFLRLVNNPYIKRVSILGGEPLANENIIEVSRLIKIIFSTFSDKNIWIYTGYTWEEIMLDDLRKEAVSLCDVIVDGRYEDRLKDTTLHWKGSTNQRVIDVQKSLKNGEIILW